MIHLIEVCKQYSTWAGDRIVLFPTSLTIPTDRGVGLLGRNGAGKSTLLRMIAGFEMPDHGRIVRTVSVSWPLGYGGGMNSNMTGRQNVRFIARISGADEDAAVAFVEDFAELGPYMDERVATYSSGMRGRLNFGVSLAIDFDFYLIDEGMSAGDRWFQDKAAAAFAERQRRSSGMLIVSHNPATIERYCDVAMVLHRGQLIPFSDLEQGCAFLLPWVGIMKLKGLARALIFVRSDNPVPAAKPADTMLVGTGTRLLPTIYDGLRAQRRRRRVMMALCIVLPTAFASLYYAFAASDRYVSDTKMVVKEQSGGGLSALSGGGKSLLSLVGMGAGGAGATDEAAIVTNYLQSTEAMQSLDRAIGLRRMWSGGTIDLLSRLSKDASEEDFYRYYKKRVTTVSDPIDPVIELQVEAFRPGDARQIAKTLVALAQEKLNTAFVRMREDSLQFARSEVKQAEQQLATVESKLRDFRNLHGDIDPAKSAEAVGTVASSLFGQLALTEAELRTTLSYAREDSPAAKALRARIDALKQQIAADRGLLAGRDSDKPYADLLGAYQDLLLDEKFAQDAYTSAMAFLATSRTDLERQHAYLVDFIAPSLPQEATEPRGARNVLVTFVGSALIWLIGTLVVSAMREHARQ